MQIYYSNTSFQNQLRSPKTQAGLLEEKKLTFDIVDLITEIGGAELHKLKNDTLNYNEKSNKKQN